MLLSSLKNLNNKLIFLPPNNLPRKTLWCKNQENPSDRKSHTWAPLRRTTGVNDTNGNGGKFAAGVVDTGGAP